MKIAAEFTGRWTICWVTTFTFEPAFFESFLLKRLGDPPLNVAVIADFSKLTELWAQVDAHELNVRAANRRYLVRGAAIAGGAFHPKTILIANKSDGVLFVGSGNLGLSGVEQGREVFTRFDSRREEDLPAFKTWRAWMNDVVALVDDGALRSRFADVLARAPWLAGAPTDTKGLVTNWRTPLIDALFSGQKRWSELHVSAPFFDADVGALRELLTRSSPKRVSLYLGKNASVDGRRLLEVLRGSQAAAQTYAFEPAEFVHAKLIALVQGQRARVLSGSPNLSGPALLRAVTAGGANAEVGVISEMPADEARALFVPPGLSATALDEASLRMFRLTRIAPLVALPVRLSSATQAPSGVVTVAADPLGPGLSLTDGTTSVALRDARTARAFPAVESAVLVWLSDAKGAPMSNRVPLDDQVALDRSLRGSTTSDERPPDFDALDVQHPMGRLLAELHQAALFEIDNTPAAHRVADLAEASQQDSSDFWDRLLKEQLAQDPRAARYATRSAATTEPFADELGHLLDQMLHQVPTQGRLRLISGEELERGDVEHEGRKWTPSQRLAVRAYNVLHRWSLAVADPRIRWLSESAPLVHYIGLLGALLRIWQQREWIPEHRLAKIAKTLFGAFIRTERTTGYLEALGEAERVEFLAQIRTSAAPQVAAAIAFAALRSATPDEFFEWQPFLTRGLEWDVFAPGDETGALVASLVGLKPTSEAVTTRLEMIADYTDDEHWCRRQREELGFSELLLSEFNNPNYPLEIRLDAEIDLRADPRVVALAIEALAYADVPGVRLRSGSDVLAVGLDKPVYGFVRGSEVDSAAPITAALLDELIRNDLSFGSLVGEPAQVAS